MPTPVDDLKIGMWITAVAVRFQIPQRLSMFGMEAEARATFDGRPWQIVAISLPFVCLRSGDAQPEQQTMDLRDYDVQQLTPEYVAACYCRPVKEVKAQLRTPRKPTEPERDERDCPCCGERIVQKYTVSHGWFIVCPACGFEPPKVSS